MNALATEDYACKDADFQSRSAGQIRHAVIIPYRPRPHRSSKPCGLPICNAERGLQRITREVRPSSSDDAAASNDTPTLPSFRTPSAHQQNQLPSFLYGNKALDLQAPTENQASPPTVRVTAPSSRNHALGTRTPNSSHRTRFVDAKLTGQFTSHPSTSAAARSPLGSTPTQPAETDLLQRRPLLDPTQPNLRSPHPNHDHKDNLAPANHTPDRRPSPISNLSPRLSLAYRPASSASSPTAASSSISSSRC